MSNARNNPEGVASLSCVSAFPDATPLGLGAWHSRTQGSGWRRNPGLLSVAPSGQRRKQFGCGSPRYVLCGSRIFLLFPCFSVFSVDPLSYYSPWFLSLIAARLRYVIRIPSINPESDKSQNNLPELRSLGHIKPCSASRADRRIVNGHVEFHHPRQMKDVIGSNVFTVF